MKIIRPSTLDSSNLVSSTVPEVAPAAYDAGTTYAAGTQVSVFTGTVASVYESLQNSNTGHTPASSPLWWDYLGATYASYSGGTTYALGDIVIDPTTHHEFESLQAGNTGHALTDAAWWSDLGADNRYRMFDLSNTSQTSAPQGITIVAQMQGRTDSVALLNIVAASVQIIARYTGIIVFDQTYDLISDSGVTNWYEYFFEPIVRKGDLIVTDLPLYADMEITVIINEPTGTAQVGTCVIGLSRDLGNLLYGARVGIQDYSRKVADDFGNWTIVERAFSKRADFRIAVEPEKVDAITAVLALYRATPVVYVGTEEFSSTIIYGFYRDFSNELTFPSTSYLTLQIEGLT
ncbi:hypothetical protein [Sphingobium bisphenolivorans]|uniref:hypothetical protein n=1 Tax=Sphingobium bisphenolivorans TaxID=1335760 RepID=UPI00039F77EE|nr:hypothetical protein [Sphingobium bisphenolivorans]